MKLKTLIPGLIGGLIVAVVMVVFGPNGGGSAVQKESAYDRVMRTGVLRCGYYIWPPFLNKEPNTGALSGFFYDLTEKLGENLSLKVEWAEEIGIADIAAALNSGRVDAYCSPQSIIGSRAREMNWLDTIIWGGFYAYVKVDDHRFKNGYQDFNRPDIIASFIEGEATGKIATKLLPKMGRIELPQLSTPADSFNNLLTGKADLVLKDPTTAAAYMKANPNKIKSAFDEPLVAVGAAITLAKKDLLLKETLNAAQAQLLYEGEINKLMEKYDLFKQGLFAPEQYYRGDK